MHRILLWDHTITNPKSHLNTLPPVSNCLHWSSWAIHFPEAKKSQREDIFAMREEFIVEPKTLYNQGDQEPPPLFMGN